MDGTNLLRQLLECTTDCAFELDRDWRIGIVNSKALHELQLGDGIVGRHILDLYPQLAETPFWPVYRQVMEDRRPRHAEGFIPELESWYEAHVAPARHGITVFFNNIDDRKQREEALRSSEERLRKTLDYIPQMVWTAGADGRIDSFSRYWYEFTGLEPGFADSDVRTEIFHPDEFERISQNWRRSMASGQRYEDQYRLKHHSGSWRWVITRAWPERDSDGVVTRWYGTCTDIHEERLAKTALEESELLYRSVLEASADCIKILSVDGRLQLMNTPGCRNMEIDDFEALRDQPWPELWPAEMRRKVARAVEKAAGGETARFSGPCSTARGTAKWWDVMVTPMADPSGTVTGLLSISRDITENRERSRQLEWASEHDALTGLPNRRAFNSRLQAAVLRAMRSGSAIGLLLMDLDHFKHVNDTLGHASGDQLLRCFTEKLKRTLRGQDYLARLGGDEFAIILEDVDCDDDLTAVGASIATRLQEPVEVGDHFVRASTSIGGAMFPRDAASAADLMKCADTALYALKAAGRGGTKLFEDNLREEVQRIASELSLGRAAVSEQRVLPYYQPKIELSSGRVIGYEALLRWMHPSGAIQLPQTVAESFKNYELAASIGEMMQRKVIDDLAGSRLFDVGCQRVSINAAPAEFLRDDYAERLLALLDAAGVPPSALEIEVTEHVFLERHSRFVARALQVLHGKGARIALDDFGTGYSSLSHLRDFPVDVLKIDMSFIQQMCRDSEIRAIVSAVIELARSLSIDVVAEGIEHVEQLDELVRMRCAFGQGYYFGRPMPLSDFPRAFQRSAAAA